MAAALVPPLLVAALFPPLLLPHAESATTLVNAKAMTHVFLNCIFLSPPECFV
ncbi:hypothetical protein D3C84_1274160 [compost metagenome]